MREFLWAVAQRDNEIPKSLRAEPQLKDGSQLIWEAFIVCANSRNSAPRFSKDTQFVVYEKIHLSELVSFCDLYAIDDLEQRRRLVRLVQAMDAAYLEAVNPRVK